MPLQVNLRHLDAQDIPLEGELPVEELDIDIRDEVVRLEQPLRYALSVQKLESGLLVRGSLELLLKCQCVRCLKEFRQPLRLNPWTALLPLEGEEAVPIINDCVDLTPVLREDILLEFPQHPLCKPDCGGLPKRNVGQARKTSASELRKGSAAWDQLNKLKF